MAANSSLNQSLRLPCGVTLKNRLAKSAMSENMATSHHANKQLACLYQTWAQGGVGLCISGNVMVDSTALGEPRNVVIEKGNEGLDQLKQWASAGSKNNTSFWVQLNHPGAQSPKFLSPQPVGPSAIPLSAPLDKMFNTPKELSKEEIANIVNRFGYAARVCREAGFKGVQIHGAHGYLISQFLSPKRNQRQDEYGGSIENRMRFLKEVYESIRDNVGPTFPVGLKINSADFQKGGFTEEEALFVVKTLGQCGVDLIEISGGTYEAPTMMGAKESTQKREAYFLNFVKKIRPLIKTPLMLTGGFRDPRFMEQTISDGELDVIGLARALALDPEFPNKILSGKKDKSIVKPVGSRFKILNKLFTPEITYYTYQLQRMGNGLKANPNASVYRSMVSYGLQFGLDSLKRTRG
ncbi:MAG: NADH:flavin oxidoreductase/NADH oxidase family protein [Bacteriovoracia bacterium]